MLDDVRTLEDTLLTESTVLTSFTGWLGLYFGPRRGRQVQPGVFVQKPAFFVWHIMLVSFAVAGFLVFAAVTDLVHTSEWGALLALIVATAFVGLGCFAASHCVGARVIEYRDRIEMRRIRLTRNQWFFPLMAAHALLFLARAKDPGEFRGHVGFFDLPHRRLCSPEALSEACSVNKRSWRRRPGQRQGWQKGRRVTRERKSAP